MALGVLTHEDMNNTNQQVYVRFMYKQSLNNKTYCVVIEIATY